MPHAAAALNHPNICMIYEIGEHEGQRFLSMELLEGETVKQRIVGGPFGLAVMLSLGMEVADVFDATHPSAIASGLHDRA
jgi:non-specific serine/threonine protein kinase